MKMNRNKYIKFREIMKLRKLPFHWQRINCIRHHSKRDGETWKHFWLKCLTGKILNDSGHIYFTEFEFPNKAQADVYDATANAVIEFETKTNNEREAMKYFQYRAYAREVFIIKCDEVSDNIKLAERKIRHILGL